MRRLCGLGLVLLLAACGRPEPEVYSRRPLLAEGGPHLRPGLWRVSDDGCVFDEARPVGAWPACAIAMVVREDEILTGVGKDAVLREGYGLADGLPMILQVEVRPREKPPEQRYFGVRPVMVDGQIVGISRWPVACTPPRKAEGETDNTALRPGPSSVRGLAVGDDGRCLTASIDSLRAAVIASEGWTADRERLRWVRSAEQ